jgi:SAM-dependent methyltransferase
MPEWFETFDERLWPHPSAIAEDQAAFVKRALRLRKGQRVLDAPCGAGKIAIPLARMGCHVTGIDRLGRLVRYARGRCRRERLNATLRVMDLRRIDFEGEFHAAFNWFGSFGYFSDAENLDVVRRFAKALRRGGRLLIDQPGREWILRNFRSVYRRKGVTTRTRWDAPRQRVITTWTLRGPPRSTSRSSMRLYTPGQFRALFERAGLEFDTAYGTWDGESFTRSSRRLVVVARKP